MLEKGMFAFDWSIWKGLLTRRTSLLAALFSSSWNCSGMSCSNGKALMYCRWLPEKGWHGTVSEQPQPIFNVRRYLFFWIHRREMWHRWIFGHFFSHFQAKMFFYASCMGIGECCARARLRCQSCPPSEPLRNKMKVKISRTSYSWIRGQRRQINNVVGRNWKKKQQHRKAFIFFCFLFCKLLHFISVSQTFGDDWKMT